MRQLAKWVACLTAIISFAGAATAADPAVRMDGFGDPLPRGAVSRLGARTPELSVIEPPLAPKFLGDDFATFSANGQQFTSGRQLWDVATGRLIHEVKLGSRILFARNSEPFVVTFEENTLTAQALKPVLPGWEVITDLPAISPATGHALFQLKPSEDDPVRKSSTVVRSVFSGIDEHVLDFGTGATAGGAIEPWRFGLSRDGRQLSVVTRSGHVELHTLGEAKQRTKDEDGLVGLSPKTPSVTLASFDGKHLAVVPGGAGGKIQVVTSRGLEATSALRDVTPHDYGGRFGAAFLRDATQLAVLRGGDARNAPAILKVWNGTTEGMVARKTIRRSDDLRDMALWLAARGLRGEVPVGFIPLDGLPHMSAALQCQLTSTLLECTAAISHSGELVALADDLCISIWETATHKCVQRMQPGEKAVRLIFSPDDRLLLAHYEGGTALVFEAVQPDDALRDRTTKDLWNDLAGINARAARKAMLELARRGDRVLAELDLPRANSPDEIRRWITDLSAAADKAEREAAQARLHTLGPVGLPYLHAALRARPADEQIVRIRAILEHPAETVVDPEVLRGVRAIQVAALIGSESAVDRLKRIAEGKSDPRLVARAGEIHRRMRPGERRIDR